MNKYQNISSLIEDIENILDSLFTGGFSGAQGNTASRMEAAAEECGKIGLGFAAEALGRMAAAVDRRRHLLEFDYSELVSDFCLLGSYVDAVKGRIDLQVVRESLMSNIGENKPGMG